MPRSLTEWLAYLTSLHPKKIDLGLARIRSVAEALDCLQPNARVVTFAGTNGKGSCVAFCQSALLANDYTVGSYTSPHLFDFTERIKINGQPIDEQELCGYLEQIESARGETTLSYFEFTTLAALLAFCAHHLDFWLLEIGLGGRLDAVNIIEPEIAVLTTLGMDHTEWLGDNLEAIGREKAGIFRENQHAVIGLSRDILPLSVQKQINDLNLNAYYHAEDFIGHEEGLTWNWQGNGQRLSGLPLPKLPLHSAAIALQVMAILLGKLDCPLSLSVAADSLAKTQLAGRFQVDKSADGVEVIFDVAHNEQAINYLSNKLKNRPCRGKTYAVLAMLADKQPQTSLKSMYELVDAWHVASLDEPRGAEASLLVDVLGKRIAISHKTVALAFQQAFAGASTDDRIVVFGSFLTVEQAWREHKIT